MARLRPDASQVGSSRAGLQGLLRPNPDRSSVGSGCLAIQEAGELTQDPAVMVGQVRVGQALDDAAVCQQARLLHAPEVVSGAVVLCVHFLLLLAVWLRVTFVLSRQQDIGLVPHPDAYPVTPALTR
jgi:hypothetical protein